MTFANYRTMGATQRRLLMLRAALLVICVALLKVAAFAQAENLPPIANKPNPEKPLTSDERAGLFKLIKSLQERIEKLEAARGSDSPPAPVVAPAPTPEPPAPVTTTAPPQSTVDDDDDDDDEKSYGRYTPNFGFKVVNTESGDLNISVYTYARYLNQLGLNSNYVDAFGNTKSVQERQDFQLQKVQIKLLGWIFDPKFRYFIYTWTSNPTQGQGAQVVVAGNLNYTFNKYATLSAGITSLPGVRTTEGNFPFWLSVDSRHIADEFFRPSYTSGIWAKRSE